MALRLGRASLALTALALCVKSASAATITYNDGLQHTIPGDGAFTNGNAITLINNSSLVINGGANVVGGASNSATVSTGGPGVSAASGSAIQMNGGTVNGGEASTIGNAAGAITATGGTGVVASGGFTATGGTIVGGEATAEGDLVTVTTATATGGVGLSIQNSTATLSNLTVTGGNSSGRFSTTTDTSIGGIALQVVNSTLTVQSGTYEGGGGDTLYQGLTANGVAVGGDALRIAQGSQVTLNGGTFRGGFAGALAGIIDGSELTATATAGNAITTTDGVTLNIKGGTYTSSSVAGGTIGGEIIYPPNAALELRVNGASGPTRITIKGGTFETARSIYVPLTANAGDDATIDILGGTFDDPEDPAIDIVLEHPDVVTKVYGSAFFINNVAAPYGAITQTTGTLTGILASGETFTWQFLRMNDAPFILAEVPESVPEPGTLSILGVASLGLLLRRRR